MVGHFTFKCYGRRPTIATVFGFVVFLGVLLGVGVCVWPHEVVWGVLGIGSGGVSGFLGYTFRKCKEGANEHKTAKRTEEEIRLFAASALTGSFCIGSLIVTFLSGFDVLTRDSFTWQCGFSGGTFIVLSILLCLADTRRSSRPLALGELSPTTARPEHELTDHEVSAEGERVEENSWV